MAPHGTFYEGFDQFYDKSPPNHIADNKNIGYNENYEQPMLLS